MHLAVNVWELHIALYYRLQTAARHHDEIGERIIWRLPVQKGHGLPSLSPQRMSPGFILEVVAMVMMLLPATEVGGEDI